MTHFEQFPKVQKDKTKNRGIFKKWVNVADDPVQMCLQRLRNFCTLLQLTDIALMLPDLQTMRVFQDTMAFYKTLYSYLLRIILSFIVRESNYFQSGSPKFTVDYFAIFLGFFYKCNKEQIATMVKKMSYFGQWPAKGNICILGLRPTFVCLLNVVMGRQIQILHNNIS